MTRQTIAASAATLAALATLALAPAASTYAPRTASACS